MSKQYLKQVKSLEKKYDTAYGALKDYCTGWQTLLNPKRWAIRRLLTKIELLDSWTPSDVVLQAVKDIPSLQHINPTSKLAAVFFVIQKRNHLSPQAEKAVQKIIKLDKKQKESTVVKILERYSAWWIVRLFRGELGNAHVQYVRAVLKKYHTKDADYQELIDSVRTISFRKGDALSGFELIIIDAANEATQGESNNDTHKNESDASEEGSSHHSENIISKDHSTLNQSEETKRRLEAQHKEAEELKEKIRLEEEARQKEEARKAEEEQKEQERQLKEQEAKRQLEAQQQKEAEELRALYPEDVVLQEKEKMQGFKNTLEAIVKVYDAAFYQREFPVCRPAEFQSAMSAMYTEVVNKLNLDDIAFRNFLKNDYADLIEWISECEKQHEEFLRNYEKERSEESSRLKLLNTIKGKISPANVSLKNLCELLNQPAVLLGISEELRQEKLLNLKVLIDKVNSFKHESIKNFSFAQLQEIDKELDSIPDQIRPLKVDAQGNDLQRNYQDNSEIILHKIATLRHLLTPLNEEYQYITFRQKIEFEHPFHIQDLIRDSKQLMDASESICASFKLNSNRRFEKTDRLDELDAMPERIKAQRQINGQFISACKKIIEERQKQIAKVPTPSNDTKEAPIDFGMPAL